MRVPGVTATEGGTEGEVVASSDTKAPAPSVSAVCSSARSVASSRRRTWTSSPQPACRKAARCSGATLRLACSKNRPFAEFAGSRALACGNTVEVFGTTAFIGGGGALSQIDVSAGVPGIARMWTGSDVGTIYGIRPRVAAPEGQLGIARQFYRRGGLKG